MKKILQLKMDSSIKKSKMLFWKILQWFWLFQIHFFPGRFWWKGTKFLDISILFSLLWIIKQSFRKPNLFWLYYYTRDRQTPCTPFQCHLGWHARARGKGLKSLPRTAGDASKTTVTSKIAHRSGLIYTHLCIGCKGLKPFPLRFMCCHGLLGKWKPLPIKVKKYRRLGTNPNTSGINREGFADMYVLWLRLSERGQMVNSGSCKYSK